MEMMDCTWWLGRSIVNSWRYNFLYKVFLSGGHGTSWQNWLLYLVDKSKVAFERIWPEQQKSLFCRREPDQQREIYLRDKRNCQSLSCTAGIGQAKLTRRTVQPQKIEIFHLLQRRLSRDCHSHHLLVSQIGVHLLLLQERFCHLIDTSFHFIC